MITEQQQEQASLYALGALPEAEARVFDAELRGNAELAELVRSLQRTAGLMALSAPLVQPPAALRGKVLQRIDEIAGIKKSAARPSPAALAGLNFIEAAADKDWKPLPVPGTFIKLLSIERDRGYAPIHWRRKAIRGFNQALLLCEELPQELIADASLMRVRATKPQVGLSQQARLANLKGAFRAETAAVVGKHILLVDDVMTTGQTLRVCAQELKLRGAKTVGALVFARSDQAPPTRLPANESS